MLVFFFSQGGLYSSFCDISFLQIGIFHEKQQKVYGADSYESKESFQMKVEMLL